MAERDSNTIILNKPTVLLVTGVGVGLLTLTYVLGVQVGKQSAALKLVRNVASEDLTELPTSLDEQLKQIEALTKNRKEILPPPRKVAETPKPEVKDEAKGTAKPEGKSDHKPEAKKETTTDSKKEGKWTLQLIATTDEKEAKRLAEKVKAAGFVTTTRKEGNKFKVRLQKAGSHADMESALTKLKAKSLTGFPVKVE